MGVQFFRRDEPTCSLTLWACVVPPPRMQHAVLLGRNSWVRFKTRSYRVIPPRPRDNQVLGERTLFHHATTGVAAFAVKPASTNGGFTSSMITLHVLLCRASPSCLRLT